MFEHLLWRFRSAVDCCKGRGSGSVFCGVSAPFFRVLVHTNSVCAHQESVSQSYVSSGSSVVGLMPTFSKRAYAIPRSTATRAPALQQSTADPYLLRKPSNTVLSQSLWGLWGLVHTRYFWALWESLVDMGFDSKQNFTPPTILLWLLLCPWTWGISLKLLQHHATLNMPENLENSAVATGLENVSFHFNPKEKQCQLLSQLPSSHTLANSQNSRS